MPDFVVCLTGTLLSGLAVFVSAEDLECFAEDCDGAGEDSLDEDSDSEDDAEDDSDPEADDEDEESEDAAAAGDADDVTDLCEGELEG